MEGRWSRIAVVTASDGNESDEEIAARVRDMKAGRPDLDWDNLLTGRLAGPATDDRPDFPIWDYLDVVEADPNVSLRTLSAARFPVRYQEGIWSVTSIDEELRPTPTSYKGTLPAPRFVLDEAAIVRRYRALHEAGLIEWDAPSRGLVFLVPAAVYRPVMRAWADDEARRGGANSD